MLIEFWDTDVTVDPSALPGELGFQIGVYEESAPTEYGVTLTETEWHTEEGITILPPQALAPVEQDGEAYLYRVNPPAPPIEEVTFYQLTYLVTVPLDSGASYSWRVTVGRNMSLTSIRTVRSVLAPGASMWGVEFMPTSDNGTPVGVRLTDYIPRDRQIQPPRPEPQPRFDREVV